MAAKFGNIQVYGNPQFEDATVVALSLLRSSQWYPEIIEPNLEVIQFAPSSRRRHSIAAQAFATPGIKSVRVYSQESVLGCRFVYASLLAHEAYHNYLFNRFMRLGDKRLWKWHRYYYRNKDEFRCKKFEVRICRELGFPDELRDWMESTQLVIPLGLPRKQIRILNHLRRLSLKLGSAETSHFSSDSPKK